MLQGRDRSAVAADDDRAVQGGASCRVLAALIASSTIYIVACASRALLVQPFKRDLTGPFGAPLNVPVFHTIAGACSWPISIGIWIAFTLHQRGAIYIDNWRYRMPFYIVLGALDAFQSFTANVGLNLLPAALYTIVKGSSMIMSMALSKALTSKRFNQLHYLSGAMNLSSVVIVSLWRDARVGNVPAAVAAPSSWSPFLIALACCLVSSFGLSALGVVTYVLFRHEKCRSDLVVIVESNAMQSVFTFVFLMPAMWSAEVTTWPAIYDRIVAHRMMPEAIALSVCLCAVRPIILLASIWVTAAGSNVLASALGAPRRLVVIVVSCTAFHESFSLSKALASTLMLASFVVYVYAGHQLQRSRSPPSVALDKISPR